MRTVESLLESHIQFELTVILLACAIARLNDAALSMFRAALGFLDSFGVLATRLFQVMGEVSKRYWQFRVEWATSKAQFRNGRAR